LKIANVDIRKKVFIIAEAGVNHEGSFENALRLIDEAAEAGVDCIKFQSYKTSKLIARENKERFAQRSRFELGKKQNKELARYAEKKGLAFLSTVLDCETADELESLVCAYKIASLDLLNYKLMQHILQKNKTMIISLGMTTDEEVRLIIDFILNNKGRKFLNKKVVFLHCVSAYPVKNPASLNLLSIPYLKEKYKLSVGYSDHSLGGLACLAAVALGARVIEKHFTLDKTMPGIRDHALSANKEEMKQLVQCIRYIEQSLGVKGKIITREERENIRKMKRSFILTQDCRKGAVIKDSVLEAVINPSEGGISSRDYFKIIGKRLKAHKNKYEIVNFYELQ